MVTQTFASTNEPSLISPYLNHKEASFIGLNLAEPSRIRNLSPINTASPAATKQAQPRGRSKEDDDEIGVFRAEKYFNGAIDADDTSSRSSSTTTATRSSCHGHQRYRQGRIQLSTSGATSPRSSFKKIVNLPSIFINLFKLAPRFTFFFYNLPHMPTKFLLFFPR